MSGPGRRLPSLLRAAGLLLALAAGTGAQTPLGITTTSLPVGHPGVAYSASVVATGGTSNYIFFVSQGSLPRGLKLDSGTGALGGTPTQTQVFVFTVTVYDSSQASASAQLRIVVEPPIEFPGAPPPAGEVGLSYSYTLSATGGIPPFAWSISSGAPPPGLSLSAVAIAGTPQAAGTFSFILQATDSASIPASLPLSITIRVPALGGVNLALNGNTGALQQPQVQVALSGPYPLPITGTLTLTFTPDAVAPSDDLQVRFSNGARTATLTIAANALEAVFDSANLAVQGGTVAGTITLTLSVQAGGQDITPSPAPTRSFPIQRSAPVLRAVSVNRSGSGFEVLATGYSTPRQVTQAIFRFTPAPGSGLQTTELTIPADSLFSRWYQDPASAQFGSQFTFSQSFTINGDPNAIASLSVALVNDQGQSQAVSSNY